MVQERDDIVGLDAGILMHPEVWVTSGHVGLVQRPARRVRAPATAASGSTSCPGAEDLTATELQDEGIVETPRPASARSTRARCPRRAGSTSCSRRTWARSRTRASVIYLRPETAQGSYVNFKNVQQLEPQEGALRHRPDRQVVPQRDQPRQLRLPHARVRADGDAVLRAARRARGRGVRGVAAARARPGTSATA